MIQMTPAGQLAFMNNALVSAGNGNFVAAKVHLYKSLVTNPPVVPADFEEANFAGYTVATPTFVPRITGDNGTGFSSETNFAATDAVTPNTIYGHYITDTTSAVLLGWDSWAPGIPMTNGSSVLNLTINVVVPANSNWGFSITA